MDVTDEDAMRDCYDKALTINWRSDDGQNCCNSPDLYFWANKCLGGLIAPEGTFELDALLSDCPDPGSPLLDDNSVRTWFSFPARLFLGELLERSGMYEQAIAQLQPALVFSSCNARLKIRVWLLLGRCHVALGHKVSRWYSANLLV